MIINITRKTVTKLVFCVEIDLVLFTLWLVNPFPQWINSNNDYGVTMILSTSGSAGLLLAITLMILINTFILLAECQCQII